MFRELSKTEIWLSELSAERSGCVFFKFWWGVRNRHPEAPERPPRDQIGVKWLLGTLGRSGNDSENAVSCCCCCCCCCCCFHRFCMLFSEYWQMAASPKPCWPLQSVYSGSGLSYPPPPPFKEYLIHFRSQITIKYIK